MLQPISRLLPVLPLVFSAPAPVSTPDISSLQPVKIFDFDFRSSSVTFTFNDPNTKLGTTCSASSIPTSFTACANPDVEFKFAPGDKASAFHFSLREKYTNQDTYVVVTARREVTNSPWGFDVPVGEVYPFKPFELPKVFNFSPSLRPGTSIYKTLNFTITDVNGNGKATTNCSTQWISGQQPPNGDIPCADPNFVFRVPAFKGIAALGLDLSHTYPLKQGAAPKITSSGSVTFVSGPDADYSCTCGGSGVCSCGIVEGKVPLKAPITSVTGF